MAITLVDKLYKLIHQDIISLRLKPGERLHIAELAKEYEVGPGPIREALSRLIATQLVVALSQRGFRVAEVSKSDLHDLYQTRTEIEAIALRYSILQGDDQWESNVIATYHRLAKYEEKISNNTRNYQEWEIRHRDFNKALISGCRLDNLLRIHAQLYDLTERYRRQWLLSGLKPAEGLPYAKEQKKIMEAALSRNTELAVQLLFKHFEKAVRIIESYFTEQKLF